MVRLKLLNSFLLILAFISVCGCKNSNNEEGIDLEFAAFSSEFINQFKEKIDDENEVELIDFFKINRSQKATGLLIDIFRNKDPFIKCQVDFERAKFEKVDEEKSVVFLPISLIYSEYPDQEPDKFIVKATFSKFNNSFQITDIEGDLLHQRFTAFNNRNFWETEFALEYEKRKGIYDIVNRLQSGVDSIIWFAKYKDRLYFYYVEGEWVNSKYDNINRAYDSMSHKANVYKMGLMDEEGKLIIPAEYDLIGTLGFDLENIVEVKRNGKYGMYHLESKLPVIPSVYDVLIPYLGEKNLILVKEGDRNGWYNSDYLYFDGLPPIPDIDKYLENHRYLSKNLVIQQGNQTMMEIPDKEYLGNGFIVPPSYLTNLQLIDSIDWGYLTTKKGFNAGLEKKEFTGLSIQSIKEKFKAFIVLVKDKYMDGREEFYHYNKVAILDEINNLQSVNEFSGSDLMSIRYLSDLGYFEGKTTNPYFLWDIDVPEFGIQNYNYFQIAENGKLINLSNNRVFNQTKFAKLDSSYIIGKFLVQLDSDKTMETEFLSSQTIQYMLDEILAENGFLFPDPNRGSYFYDTYKNNGEEGLEREPSLEKVVQKLNEIEKHNYEFLLGLLPKTIAIR